MVVKLEVTISGGLRGCKVAARETHGQENRVNYMPWELATGRIICTGKKKIP